MSFFPPEIPSPSSEFLSADSADEHGLLDEAN